MALSPDGLIKAANSELIEGKQTNNEEKLRSAISKLYYGVYHTSDTLDNILSDHNGIRKGGVHEQRTSKFKDYPLKNRPDLMISEDIARNIRSFGHMMNQLRGDRVKADYEISIDITSNDADQAFSNGMRAIAKLNEIYKVIPSSKT
jgi:uncharacterized protein (UPF0332 family)